LPDQTKGVTPAVGRQDGLRPWDPGPGGVFQELSRPKNLKNDKKCYISAARHDSNQNSSGLPSSGTQVVDETLCSWSACMLGVILIEFSQKISRLSEFWRYHSCSGEFQENKRLIRSHRSNANVFLPCSLA
jgi:hypothetical protein